MNPLHPRPLKIAIGSFKFFLKIRWDYSQVNDTGGKLFRQCQHQWQILPPVSMTLAVNLLPASTTPVAKNGNDIRLLTP
jgi:hypothetical protein